MDLQNKVAVVTGAAQGIGAKIADMLEERGAKVARLDIAEPTGDTGQSIFIKCDVRSVDDWTAAIAQVKNDLGDINALFLNAGVMSRPQEDSMLADPLDVVGTDAYDRIFDVNVHGYVLGLNAAIKSLEANAGDAVVVATASTAGISPLGFDPYYAMTKHAVVGFARSFGEALAPRGVRVFAICPGGVKTEIVPHDMAELKKSFMEVEELAQAAIDLLDLENSGEVWVKDQAGRPRWRLPPYDL